MCTCGAHVRVDGCTRKRGSQRARVCGPLLSCACDRERVECLLALCLAQHSLWPPQQRTLMGVSVVPAMTWPWKGSMKMTRPSLVCVRSIASAGACVAEGTHFETRGIQALPTQTRVLLRAPLAH